MVFELDGKAKMDDGANLCEWNGMVSRCSDWRIMFALMQLSRMVVFNSEEYGKKCSVD